MASGTGRFFPRSPYPLSGGQLMRAYYDMKYTPGVGYDRYDFVPERDEYSPPLDPLDNIIERDRRGQERVKRDLERFHDTGSVLPPSQYPLTPRDTTRAYYKGHHDPYSPPFHNVVERDRSNLRHGRVNSQFIDEYKKLGLL